MAIVIKENELTPTAISEVAQRRLLTGKNLMIQSVEAKAGAQFEAHSHPEEQMGYVVRGSIEFFLGEDGKPTVMDAGTFFHFAPHEKHGSRVIEDVMMIDVFSPPRAAYVNRPVQTGASD